MNLKERFDYSLHNLKYRQLRTWLTVLGIVVGIASIIILVSLADGLKANVEGQLSSFDPSTIMIIPVNIQTGGSSLAMSGSMAPTSGKLYERDYQKIRGVDGVKLVSKVISNRAPLKYKTEVVSASIYAVEPNVFRDTSSFTVNEGRFLSDSDRGVAVLGSTIANDNFKTKINVGDEVEIAGRKYHIVGILDKTGGSFAQFDSVVFITFDEGRDMFSDQLVPNEITVIRAQVAPGYNVEDVRAEIESTLMNLHKVTEEDKDFSVIDAKVIGEQINSVIGILTIFLGAVAAIALLVGTIGVSNTMFMAVMERTHEIGVLKAIGATNRDILLTFTIEAGLIGLVGGLVGVAIGTGFSLLLILIGVQTKVTLELVIGSAIFAFIVGIAAGILPAKNASEVPAIEALRYE